MWYHMQAYCVWNQNADHKCIGLLTFPSILYECINQASFFIVFVLFQPQSKLVPFPGHSDRQYWLLTICTRWTEGGEGFDHNNAFHPCISCVLCTMTSGIARILKLPGHRGCTLSREARKKNFAFIFQLPRWALVAPSYFALQAILAY